MIELRDELLAAPMYERQDVPFTENHHLWRLRWYRLGDNGHFIFSFISPKGRVYSFGTEVGRNGAVVTYAEVTLASGETIASYWAIWGDKVGRMDAVLRLTPAHVLHRLFLLLDAIDAIG